MNIPFHTFGRYCERYLLVVFFKAEKLYCKTYCKLEISAILLMGGMFTCCRTHM